MQQFLKPVKNYFWAIAVLSAFNIASTSIIRDDQEIIKAFLQNRLNAKIPASVIDEIKRENIPAKIHLVQRKDVQQIPVVGVSAVDPNYVTDVLLKDIDDVIESSGIDPYTLADFDCLGISVTLTISNFDTLHRSGNATMTINDPYNYEFYSNVQVKKLTGDFSLSFTFLRYDYNIDVNVKVDTVDANVHFTVSINPENNATYIYVNSLDSYNIGKVTVKVTGLGALNPLINIIADIAANLFKFIIPIFFNGIFLNIINQIAGELFPPWQ